jgi:hypothetical protein
VFSSASFLFSSREHGCVSFRPPMERQRVGGGSWPRSRRKAGSCPAPSRGVNGPRNEGSILLCEGGLCAPWHKSRQSTKEAPNFVELRQHEVRRIPLPRTPVNSLKKVVGACAAASRSSSTPALREWRYAPVSRCGVDGARSVLSRRVLP